MVKMESAGSIYPRTEEFTRFEASKKQFFQVGEVSMDLICGAPRGEGVADERRFEICVCRHQFNIICYDVM